MSYHKSLMHNICSIHVAENGKNEHYCQLFTANNAHNFKIMQHFSIISMHFPANNERNVQIIN